MINGPCGDCIWADDFFDTCKKLSVGLRCFEEQPMQDCSTDCVICPTRYVCSISPFCVGVGGDFFE